MVLQDAVAEQLGPEFKVVLDSVTTADPALVIAANAPEQAPVTPTPPDAPPTWEPPCQSWGLNYTDPERCPSTFGVVIVAQYQKLLAFARIALGLQTNGAVEAFFNTSILLAPAGEQAAALESDLTAPERQDLYEKIIILIGVEPSFGMPCNALKHAAQSPEP